MQVAELDQICPTTIVNYCRGLVDSRQSFTLSLKGDADHFDCLVNAGQVVLLFHSMHMVTGCVGNSMYRVYNRIRKYYLNTRDDYNCKFHWHSQFTKSFNF